MTDVVGSHRLPRVARRSGQDPASRRARRPARRPSARGPRAAARRARDRAVRLVVVNLYPFVETVRSGAQGDDVVEQIDIGGPAMVRHRRRTSRTSRSWSRPSRIRRSSRRSRHEVGADVGGEALDEGRRAGPAHRDPRPGGGARRDQRRVAGVEGGGDARLGDRTATVSSPSSHSATCTAQSSRGGSENSRVPSRGSMIQTRRADRRRWSSMLALLSSDITASSGRCRRAQLHQQLVRSLVAGVLELLALAGPGRGPRVSRSPATVAAQAAKAWSSASAVTGGAGRFAESVTSSG